MSVLLILDAYSTKSRFLGYLVTAKSLVTASSNSENSGTLILLVKTHTKLFK